MPTLTRSACVLCAFALGVACLPAVDEELSQLRVSLGTTPGPYRVSEEYTAGSHSTRASGTTSYKATSQAVDLYVGYQGASLHSGGFTYGFGIDVANAVYAPRGQGEGSVNYSTILPEVRLGYAYAYTSQFHVEVTPFVGYGLAMTDWKDGGKRDTGYGTALVYGVLAGGYARLGYGWSLGLDLGYQGGYAQTSVTNGSTNGQSDLTFRSSGVIAHIGVGYVF
jgi:hypothetical protein